MTDTSTSTPSTSCWFDPNFDQELSESLLKSCQETVGCFECGDPSPSKTCTRCKLAKYCSQECQIADWKKSHKQLCNIYRDNQQPKGPNDSGAPMPILLRSVGLLSETDFDQALEKRCQLFFQMTQKSTQKPLPMSFSCAIVPLFQKLRLVIVPSFSLSPHHQQPTLDHQVPHLFVRVVDEDSNSIDHWEATQEITNRAFSTVVEKFLEFYTEIETYQIQPLVFTCGSGLHNRLDQLEEKLQKRGISNLRLVPIEHLLL